MKYTRKELFKITLPAGVLLITPPIISLFNKYYIKVSEPYSTFISDNKNFAKTLEDWKTLFAKNDLLLDILIINYQSIKKFDFVFLSYNRKYHDAPIIAIPKNECYYPKFRFRFRTDVRILKNFAQRHGIYTLENYDCDLLKRIKDCGEGHCISKDLYRSVSFMYAEMYRDKRRSKYLSDLGIG